MANIRVDLDYTIKDGSSVVFRSPCDCTEITGLIVYYIAADGSQTSKEFLLADAHGENVGDIPHLFASDVVVKVILDVTSGMAFVQNADTNAYIERTFVKTVNGKSPDENGNVTVSGGGGGSGDPGEDGFSPIATVEQTDSGAVISITDKNGTTTATVTNGKDGNPGTDGVSPTVEVSKSGKVTTISITDKNGTKTATINDGADGGAGSVSWNDLTDRPFGEKMYYEWNKDTVYQESISTNAGTMVKISDDAPEMSSFLGEKIDIVTTEDTLSDTITEEYFYSWNDEVYTIGETIIVAQADSFVEELDATFTKGIWHVSGNDYVVSTRISGGVKCLDEEFIPDTIARTADVQTMIDTALGVIENGTY